MGLWQAAGHIPSPLGDISISWERTDISWELELEIPRGMSAEIRLPRLGTELQELRVNGQLAATAPYWEEVVPLFLRKDNHNPDRTTHLECRVEAEHHRVHTIAC
jgi:hypothetical protein